MNTRPIVCLIGATTLGFAGEPAYTPAPAPIIEDSGWILGGGVDYMIDAEEAYWNGHIGYQFNNSSSVFLEVGWMDIDEDYSNVFSIDVDIVPVTINYKHEWCLGENFGLYAGAGLGASYLNMSVDTNFGDFDDSDWAFTAQAFAGVTYHFTPTFEAYAGARYLWINDSSLGGVDVDDLDDWGIGGGIRFRF